MSSALIYLFESCTDVSDQGGCSYVQSTSFCGCIIIYDLGLLEVTYGFIIGENAPRKVMGLRDCTMVLDVVVAGPLWCTLSQYVFLGSSTRLSLILTAGYV